MTVHERPWGDSREWFTPASLFDALGIRFDLDPASPMSGPVPWVPADRFYSPRENGLVMPWEGRVWLNPPYGPPLVPFIHRMVAHDDGMMLVPARTETRWFQYAAAHAHAVCFLRDRLHFTREDGFTGRASHASVLMAFGLTKALMDADLGWTVSRHRSVALMDAGDPTDTGPLLMTGKGWLLDPVTREPLPALPVEVRPRSTAAHWAIERDASGIPVRMRWVFCDDPKCCPPFPERP